MVTHHIVVLTGLRWGLDVHGEVRVERRLTPRLADRKHSGRHDGGSVGAGWIG